MDQLHRERLAQATLPALEFLLSRPMALTRRTALAEMVIPNTVRKAFHPKIVAGTVLLGALTLPVLGDTALIFEQRRTARRAGQELASEQRQIRVWIREERARLDRGKWRFILQRDKGRLLLVNDAEKTYMALRLPVKPEEYLDAEMLQLTTLALDQVNLRIDLRLLGAKEAVGSWPARRYHLEVTAADGTVFHQGEFWVSQALPVALSLHKELLRTIDGLDFYSRTWLNRIHELEGTIVQRTRIREQKGVVTTARESLTSIREVDPEPNRYEAPAEYEQVPVDPRIFGGAGQPVPLPNPY